MLFYAFVVAGIVVVHLYLWKRLVADTIRPGWRRRAGTAVMVILGVTVAVTLFGVRNGYVQWLGPPGYLWVAVMFYLMVTLAVLEVPRWVIARRRRASPRTRGEAEAPASATDRAGVERRLVLARGAAIFAGLTATGITTYGVRTAAGPPRLDRFQMPMKKLPRTMDGYRLAVVSDIHIGPRTGVEHARRITRMINSMDADVVCVVGDLVDGTVPQLGRFVEPLAGLRSRRGTYFVTGNHEYYSGVEEWIGEVTELGMRPLLNERVEIDGLYLAGVNDYDAAEHGGEPADYARALGDRDTTRPTILMAHQPVAAEDAAPYRVDLQISGHTHGGQMVPFNLLVRLAQPVVSGFGTVDGVPVYVTNGAGSWGPPVRVGAPPQVTLIELRTA
ncbi:metallophosphoesterase [Actinoplanes sp. NPDC023714]|uniref:metallophosphoesterase n=1 Tax=Actinoplanes sp. NPDC023714 TaxID=3154322 RepID=UPI0033FAC9CA